MDVEVIIESIPVTKRISAQIPPHHRIVVAYSHSWVVRVHQLGDEIGPAAGQEAAPRAAIQ